MVNDSYGIPNIDLKLRTKVTLEDDREVVHYLCHPDGPRRQRRYHQRHRPYFHKTRTGGRDWERILRDHYRKHS